MIISKCFSLSEFYFLRSGSSACQVPFSILGFPVVNLDYPRLANGDESWRR